MSDQKLTIDLRGVGNDIPTRLGKSRPTLTRNAEQEVMLILKWRQSILRRYTL
jgi:hypothetical protein